MKIIVEDETNSLKCDFRNLTQNERRQSLKLAIAKIAFLNKKLFYSTF